MVIRQFAAPFAASLVVALFLLTAQFLGKYQDKLFGKGLPTQLILELFGLAMVQMSTIAVPLALLMASLLTFGRLGERYEIAALKAGGVGLLQFMRPLLLVACLAAGLVLWFNWKVVPAANLKLYSKLHDAKNARPEMVFQPGETNQTLKNVMLYHETRAQNGTMKEVFIWDNSTPQQTVVLWADSARSFNDKATRYLVLTLYNGVRYVKSPKKPNQPPAESEFYFDTLIYKVDVARFALDQSDNRFFSNHRYMMTIPQLAAAMDSTQQLMGENVQDARRHFRRQLRIDLRMVDAQAAPVPESMAVLSWFAPSAQETALRQTQQRLRGNLNYLDFLHQKTREDRERHLKTVYEFYLKFVLPAVCIVFLFVGAPLGAIIRKGGLGLPSLVALGFFTLFYFSLSQGRNLSRKGVLMVEIGAWLPIFVIGPLALLLTYQAASDTPVTRLDYYRGLALQFADWVRARIKRNTA